MTREHLISTKPLLCKCKVCRCVIWFAYDEGMPVYADTVALQVPAELYERLRGRMTFNLVPNIGIWLRDIYGIHRSGIVIAEHAHRSGFLEMEQQCRIPANSKATDLKEPPF